MRALAHQCFGPTGGSIPPATREVTASLKRTNNKHSPNVSRVGWAGKIKPLGSTVGPLSAAGGPTRVLRVPEKPLVPRCLSAPPKIKPLRRLHGHRHLQREQSTRNPRRDRKTSLSPSGQVIEDCGHRKTSRRCLLLLAVRYRRRDTQG